MEQISQTKPTLYSEAVGQNEDWASVGWAEEPDLSTVGHRAVSRNETIIKNEQKWVKYTSTYGTIARDILGITPEQWSMMQVEDMLYDGDLIQVGYKKNQNLPLELQELRGVVLDTRTRTRVCPGAEFTEVIQLSDQGLVVRDLTDEEYEKAMEEKPELKEKFTSPVRPQKIVVNSAVLGHEVEFHIDTDSTIRNRVYSQGTNLKSFLWNGRVHVITNRNLDPSGEIANEEWQQKWDSDRRFQELNAERGRDKKKGIANFNFGTAFTADFARILGFDVKLFYPEGCLYSPYTYSFLLTVPNLVTSSRMVFPKAGYLTFIRKEGTWKKQWLHNPTDCPYKENIADAKEPTTFYMGVADMHGVDPTELFKEYRGDSYTDYPPADMAAPAHISFPNNNLTIEATNSILNYGTIDVKFNNPEGMVILDRILEKEPNRNFLGEAIILTKRVKHGARNIFYSVQVQSSGYAWRHRFFEQGDTQGDMYKQFVIATSIYSKTLKDFTYENLSVKYPLYQVREFAYASAMHSGAWIPLRLDEESEKVDEDLACKMLLQQVKEKPLFSFSLIPPYEGNRNVPYENMVNVTTPYFVMMMNPMRQREVVKFYSRYSQQTEMLADYITDHPVRDNKMTSVYYLGKIPLDELFKFAQLCSKKGIEELGKLTETTRKRFNNMILKIFERTNWQLKLKLLEQSTRLRGSDMLKKMMQMTSAGKSEINIKDYRVKEKRNKQERGRGQNRPRFINRETGEREFKINPRPAMKPGASRDTALRRGRGRGGRGRGNK